MTNSQFCIQQRQREQQRLKKLLVAGFVGSAALHGILAYALPKWSFNSPKAEEPMELILVDKPKPKPKVEPKIESKSVVEPKPKPVKPPEPVKAETPPPPVKPPEPVAAQTAPPKPAPKPEPTPKPQPVPKKVLTNPTPAPSQPIVSVPVENTEQSSSLSSSFTSPSNSPATSNSANSASSISKPGATGSVVATGSAPPRLEANDGGEEGISCLSNCEPEYPASLEGVEGSAGIKLTIDSSGNVVGAELVEPHSDSGINRQALLAARQMQFSSPGSSAAVRVNIDFTVEGSEYDRAAHEEQERREQAARERQEQEAARQQQLEAEQQARQEQLERERQARQEQLQQQQQEPTPPPAQTEVAEPKPLPALSPEELDEAMQRGLGGSPHERLHQEERLRKFRERMESYREK